MKKSDEFIKLDLRKGLHKQNAIYVKYNKISKEQHNQHIQLKETCLFYVKFIYFGSYFNVHIVSQLYMI